MSFGATLALASGAEGIIYLMIGPSRPLPRVGGRARITHFGGERELAVILVVEDDGRRLRVQCESGEELDFELSSATARFVPLTGSHGPRLHLIEDSA